MAWKTIKEIPRDSKQMYMRTGAFPDIVPLDIGELV